MKRRAWRLIVAIACVATAISSVHAQPVARLRGVVFDSVARGPLANASVRVFRSDSAAIGVSTRTDSIGAFSVPELRAGTWLVSFLHPRLDSLRVEPSVARVDVVEEGDVDVTLAIPSAATLARALCGATPGDSTAVVVGEVRDAQSLRPVAGARVRASWPEWVFAKRQMARELVARGARTDSTGQFVLCKMPQGTTVTALAHAESDSTGLVEIVIPNAEYVVADFIVDRRGAFATSDSASPAWRRGTGAVRGRVTTVDGAPFPTAVARVLGSGTLVRTDSGGVFRISDAAAGTQTVEVRAVGYDPIRRRVELVPGEPVVATFTLEKSRVTLDTVRVIAGRKLPPDVEAIERRWRRGLGIILDGATVRERASNYITSALFSIPGVQLGTRDGFGNAVYLRGAGGACIPTIFLDGYRLQTSAPQRGPALFQFGATRPMEEPSYLSLDELVSPQDVAAMEVYVRPAQRPAEFTGIEDCGVLVVWTRQYLGNVPVFDPRRR
jgi:hypothetical protein